MTPILAAANLGEWFTEPWQFAFMQRAFIVALMASIVGALLSTWIVHVGWSLLGDAVSHAVLPGVALAYMIGAPFTIGALVFGVGAVALIRGVHSHSRVKEDAAVGIVFSSLFAVGLVLVSKFPSEVDLSHILFGNLLGISDGDFLQVAILSVVAAAVILVRRRAFTWFAFDPAHMSSLGHSPRREAIILLGVLAVVAVAALQAAGVVLVIAMLVTPGACAHLLTNRMSTALWVSPLVAVIATIVGVYSAFYLDVETGGAIVVAYGIAFAIIFNVGPHGPIGRWMRRRRTHARRGAGVPA